MGKIDEGNLEAKKDYNQSKGRILDMSQKDIKSITKW